MRGKLIALVVLVFAVGLVGLSAVGGALYWDRVQTRAMQEASADLPLRTTEEIPPKIFGYDYQTVERSLTDAATLLTPPITGGSSRSGPQRTSSPPGARPSGGQPGTCRRRGNAERATGFRLGAGVHEPHRHRQVQTARLRRSRLRVDYQKIDGRWLIKYIQPV